MPPKAKAKSRSSSPAAPKGKAKAKAKGGAESPKPPSPEDIAATKIQAQTRGFLARRLLKAKREEKKKYDEEVAEAIRQTDLAIMRQEKKRADAERAKAEEKRRKAKKGAEDTRKALEAGYDGDVTTLEKLFDDGLQIDACDNNGITALSEAASGGAEDAVKLLLERRSNPNSRGEFERTPLWRAVYASHVACVRLLLEHGGDPRMHDTEGCCPVDVASQDALASELRAWDVAKTDDLIEDYESWAEEQRLQEAFKVKQAMQSVDAEFDNAKAAHDAAQKGLARAKAEFRNRQKEHGLGLAAGEAHAIACCKSADEQVLKAQDAAIAAQVRFDKANVKRLEAAEDIGVAPTLLGREVMVQDLNNVIMRDIGDRIAKGQKWPLIIDTGEVAKKMIAYSGCVVLSFWKPEEMEVERIRKGMLTMIRSGGVFCIDLMLFAAGVDREMLAQPFDELRTGLLDDLNSRVLLETPKGSSWPRFKEFVRPTEKGTSLAIENYDAKMTAKFKFLVVTSTEQPHQDLIDMFDVLRVSMPSG